jgi:hypothetical protein
MLIGVADRLQQRKRIEQRHAFVVERLQRLDFCDRLCAKKLRETPALPLPPRPVCIDRELDLPRQTLIFLEPLHAQFSKSKLPRSLIKRAPQIVRDITEDNRKVNWGLPVWLEVDQKAVAPGAAPYAELDRVLRSKRSTRR